MSAPPLPGDKPPAYNGAAPPPANGVPQGYGPPPGYSSYQSGAPPGYQPAPQRVVYPQPMPYRQPVTVTHTTNVVVVGGCPACRVGVLEDDFTVLGVLCAILFFPLGILCCLAMRQRRCPNCGAVFG
ncbi:brain protein I3-like [Anneissia japonica]|uniref:brain protein I3-like n=1 Tax=Anneissia japonica TaxID=1529436 RepID=UPI0014255AB0|nr:brain protein I3-like [Anneissia japonica]